MPDNLNNHERLSEGDLLDHLIGQQEILNNENNGQPNLTFRLQRFDVQIKVIKLVRAKSRPDFVFSATCLGIAGLV